MPPSFRLGHRSLWFWLLSLVAPACCLAVEAPTAQPVAPMARMRPNVVFILADDLGYGELGCYGQKRIRTPNVDRMAAEGIRFTQVYCGTSVCAPSRCSLLTGQHVGHAPIRANRRTLPEGQMPLPAGTFTVARLLKDAGYATACVGKWGLGMVGTTGDPLKNGFDHFFGYNCQNHAHDYFPKYLWRDAERVPLDGKTYSPDLVVADALDWIRAHKDGPFFLYAAFTLPHGKYEAPDAAPYEHEDWPKVERTYASMITRLDRDTGRILTLLKDLRVDDKTIVFFASDNGAAEPFAGHTPQFFQSTGPLRGLKRSMYEGGIRVPMIVRWPGHVPSGRASDEPWAFCDFLPTCAELIGARVPVDAPVDGLSVLGALSGGSAPKRECFYWELHEGPMIQAVRFGDWKAVRPGPGKPVELYNLKVDPAEQHDLATETPAVLRQATKLLTASRTDSPLWPAVSKAAKPKKAGQDGSIRR